MKHRLTGIAAFALALAFSASACAVAEDEGDTTSATEADDASEADESSSDEETAQLEQGWRWPWQRRTCSGPISVSATCAKGTKAHLDWLARTTCQHQMKGLPNLGSRSRNMPCANGNHQWMTFYCCN